MKGLTYIKDFISKEEEMELVDIIDSYDFDTSIHRRQQFYGQVYYHTTQNNASVQPNVECSDRGALPLWKMQPLINKIISQSESFQDETPNQCLVNEYKGNQGISSHIDDNTAFGKDIACVSLLNPIYLTMKKPKVCLNTCHDIVEEEKLYIEPRSLFLLQGEARYLWRHGITKAKRIYPPHQREYFIYRDETYRRLSITIRQLLHGRKQTHVSNASSNYSRTEHVWD